MNILLCITPKNQTVYIYDDFTLRQAIEKMDRHGYSAIPIINRQGEYVATITEGDLLRVVKNRYSLSIKDAEHIPIRSIELRQQIEAVSVSTRMDDLIAKSLNQNFVPVVDDRKVFIGIVTRKEIIKYCYDKFKSSGVYPDSSLPEQTAVM